MLELANTIVKLTGGTGSHRFEALRPGDVRSSTADVTRIEGTVRVALPLGVECLDFHPEEVGARKTVSGLTVRLSMSPSPGSASEAVELRQSGSSARPQNSIPSSPST